MEPARKDLLYKKEGVHEKNKSGLYNGTQYK